MFSSLRRVYEATERCWIWFAVILFCFFLGHSIIVGWAAMVLCRDTLTEERLLRAADLDPDNPEPYRRLGLFYQWSISKIDLDKAEQCFRKALLRNPLDQEFWLNLARLSLKKGNEEGLKHAIDSAIMTFPTGYHGRWIAGNLMLQKGDFENAIPHFYYIVCHYPNQSNLVYDVWSMVSKDRDFIWDRLVPRDQGSIGRYLNYLYDSGALSEILTGWQKAISLGYVPGTAETMRHIEFLISSGEIHEASRLWKERIFRVDAAPRSDGNLIFNGGFEMEGLPEGGFNWRIESLPGVRVEYDESISFEGRRSLKVSFAGKRNLDFGHIKQVVPVRPRTDYILKAMVKTRGLTTKSGLKIEVQGIGSNLRLGTRALTGDNDWRELEVAFRSPPEIQGVLIKVRREKTEKFDRNISGEAWIDHVRLFEAN